MQTINNQTKPDMDSAAKWQIVIKRNENNSLITPQVEEDNRGTKENNKETIERGLNYELPVKTGCLLMSLCWVMIMTQVWLPATEIKSLLFPRG